MMAMMTRDNNKSINELEKAMELAWKEIFRQKEFYGIEPSKFEMVKIACEATLKLKNEDKK
jgi:hypothetical protein